jgi:hypothetical protein
MNMQASNVLATAAVPIAAMIGGKSAHLATQVAEMPDVITNLSGAAGAIAAGVYAIRWLARRLERAEEKADAMTKQLMEISVSCKTAIEQTKTTIEQNSEILGRVEGRLEN